MTLSQEALQARLNRQFKYFDAVDSTNDIAKTWLLQGAPSGSAVIADEQLKGRGRKDRTWHTPAGVALAVSVILRISESHLNRVSLLGALAVYDLAVHVGCEQVGIKWPNDVQVNGKKVSGILPEAVWDGNKLIGVVLGMGVNVRFDFADTELEETAISLETVIRQALDRTLLLDFLLKRIDDWSLNLTSDKLFSTWKSRLNTLNQHVTVDTISGLAVNVDADGALLIQTDDGKIERVLAGDVLIVDRQREE